MVTLPDVWNKILNLFGKKEDPSKAQEKAIEFALEYDNKDGVNLTYTAANKVANLTVTDSDLNVTCEKSEQREQVLNNCAQAVWNFKKTIVSRAAGKGKVCLVPYCPDGERILFDIVSQDLVRVINHDGHNVTDVAFLCDTKRIKTTVYGKLKRYTLQDGNHVISELFANLTTGAVLGTVPPAATDWQQTEPFTITNVDKLLFGSIDCPIDPRNDNPFYAVKITDGCDDIIADIQKQFEYLAEEYDLKKVMLGADSALFTKDPVTHETRLPKSRVFQLLNMTGEDDKWQIFDPAIRADPIFKRLQESFKLLENQMGLSRGIFTDSENMSNYSNKSNIKRAVYDTYSMVDAFRKSIERGMSDYLYACNVLAEYFSLSPAGVKFEDVAISFSWSYDMVEDSTETFAQNMELVAGGMMSKAEGRQWNTGEDLNTAQEQVDVIASTVPQIM